MQYSSLRQDKYDTIKVSIALSAKVTTQAHYTVNESNIANNLQMHQLKKQIVAINRRFKDGIVT